MNTEECSRDVISNKLTLNTTITDSATLATQSISSGIQLIQLSKTKCDSNFLLFIELSSDAKVNSISTSGTDFDLIWNSTNFLYGAQLSAPNSYVKFSIKVRYEEETYTNMFWFSAVYNSFANVTITSQIIQSPIAANHVETHLVQVIPGINKENFCLK